MADHAQIPERTFWFQEEGAVDAVELLRLLRLYGEAEKSMRAGVRSQMGMGENDLSALRYIIACHKSSSVPRQRDIAAKLEISHASASALVDRLCAQGHAERVDLPSDRRSSGVVPTEKAMNSVRQSMGRKHQKLIDVAKSFTPGEAEVLKRFFREMIDVMEHGRVR